MEKANTEEILALFKEISLTELLSQAETAETTQEENFFRTLFNLKLGEKQQKVIAEDEFII